MPSPTRTQFPPAALAYLTTGLPRARVLTLGGAHGVPVSLANAGHSVIAINQRVADLDALARHPVATPIAARASALPFDPCQFDVVVAHQVFHKITDETSGDKALSEAARVLRPGGHLAVSYFTRDDSVPWVRRLADLLRSLDPAAMSSDFGASSVTSMLTSKYFPTHDERSFRVWVPVTRAGLTTLVARQPAIARADAHVRAQILAQVTALIDDVTAGAANARLPYELTVWRGFVDHNELTASIEVSPDALVIRI